jgi:hypothetical protein
VQILGAVTCHSTRSRKDDFGIVAGSENRQQIPSSHAANQATDTNVSANKPERDVVKAATKKQLTRPGNNAIRDCLRPKSDKFLQSRELACFLGGS